VNRSPFQAVLRRDISLAWSYRLNFLLSTFSTFFAVVLWFFFAAFLGPRAGKTVPGGYFAYVVVGTSLLGYLNVVLHTFAKKIREDQLMGTLEMLLASPSSPFALLTASCLWELILQTVQVSWALALAGLLGVRFQFGSLPALLLLFVLTLISFAAMGMLAAGILLVFQRGEPVTPFVGALFALLGNVFFPLTVLPRPLAFLARFLPLPYATDGIRKLLLEGAGAKAVYGDLTALAVFAVVLLPLSAVVFAGCLKLARRYGLLSAY
jgi:ABC-2 type transport system permease protein